MIRTISYHIACSDGAINDSISAALPSLVFDCKDAVSALDFGTTFALLQSNGPWLPVDPVKGLCNKKVGQRPTVFGSLGGFQSKPNPCLLGTI